VSLPAFLLVTLALAQLAGVLAPPGRRAVAKFAVYDAGLLLLLVPALLTGGVTWAP
jgi:hypothetical protein